MKPQTLATRSPASRSTVCLLSALVMLAFASLMPRGAFSQRDVHATLAAISDRKPAPNFRLPDERGKTTQISGFRGKVVLLNFWATSCGGCVLEIPSFIELQQKYGNANFTAIGISADIPYEGLKNADEAWQKVRPFIAAHHMNYPILVGDDAVISSYGFRSYPATFLIDRSGRVAATYVGVVSKADVDANITKLLAER